MKKTLFLLIPLLLLSACNETAIKQKKETPVIVKNTVKEKTIFSFPESKYIVKRDTIRKNQTFGEILSENNLPFPKIYKIANKIKDSFNYKQLKTGKPYTILSVKDSLDSLARPKIFIYEPDLIHYTVLNFTDIDSIKIDNKSRPVKNIEKTASVEINNSLYQDISDKELSPKLAMELSNIFAWTVDFFHLNKGDKFKVIYDDVYVDDSIYSGIGNIYAAVFNYRGKNFYAFRYPLDSTGKRFGYFDEEGRTLRKQFLKSPLKFGHITSRYNLHRFIRYYGREKPHLGTDFAAPTGTPILATANGIVTRRGYTSGNGKFIKIKHNSTYSTQYLHMSRFKKGVNVGTVVKQGDVIGYVGMTGHASGPHVCYRFWKNGKQVDALKEKLPPAKPIDKNLLPKYLSDIKNIKNKLDSIQ